MPDVRFALKDFGLKPTSAWRADFVFTPTRKAAIGPEGVLIGRVVVPWSEIDPVTGIGVATLANTTLLRPSCGFRISVEWSEAAPQGWADLEYVLQVPAEGGDLADLLQLAPPAGSYVMGYGPPPPGEPPAGVLYFDLAAPGDEVIIYGKEGAIA